MGFLDKVKDTASKAAEGVQKAAETGQDKLEEAKLKKKVGDLKEELGGVVYGQRTGAVAAGDTDIVRIVGEIQAVEQQLAELKTDAGSEST
ncbi:MAG: hypothetical protein ACXVKA_08420 [Acidimicrobiia bacterium]